MVDDRQPQAPPVGQDGLLQGFANGSAKDRLFVLLLALMSPLLAILTIEPDYTRQAMRTYSLPVLVIELVMVILALPAAGRIGQDHLQLSPGTRLLGGLWLCSMIISLWGAEFNPVGAQLRFAMTVLHVFFGVAIWAYLSDRPQLRRDCLLAAALGLGLVVVMAYGVGLWNAGRPDFAWTRFGVAVTNIRHFGYLSLGLTGIAAGLWLTVPKGRQEVLPAALFFVGAFMIMWAGGRGAFIALLVQMGVLLVLAPAGLRLAMGARLLATIVIATLLAGIYVPAPNFGPLRIFLRLDAGAMPGEEYTSGRADIWRQTAAAIPQHPWFGYGEAQFRKVIPASLDVLNHPHNLFLQLLMQWGVIGTGLLVAILARLGWQTRRLFKSPTAQTYPCVAVIAGLLAVSMVDGPFFYALPTVLFLLAFAILVAEAGKAGTFRK